MVHPQSKAKTSWKQTITYVFAGAFLLLALQCIVFPSQMSDYASMLSLAKTSSLQTEALRLIWDKLLRVEEELSKKIQRLQLEAIYTSTKLNELENETRMLKGQKPKTNDEVTASTHETLRKAFQKKTQ